MDRMVEGKKVVGAKQTLRAVKNITAKTVYVAQDADVRVTRDVIEACTETGVELVYIDTMKQLGNLFSIDVGAAVACTLGSDN